MRKVMLIAAAAIASALLPLGAVATPPGGSGSSSAPAKAHVHWFAGSVASVGGDSLTVNVLWTGPKDGQLNGTTVTVGVTGSTTIVNGKTKAAAQLGDIVPGDLVSLRATAADATLATEPANQWARGCLAGMPSLGAATAPRGRTAKATTAAAIAVSLFIFETSVCAGRAALDPTDGGSGAYGPRQPCVRRA